MSERLKILELHKENYILRYQICWKEIISYRLALSRINDMKENIDIELAKANLFNVIDNKEDSIVLYSYIPLPNKLKDVKGNTINKYDKVNFMPGKAKWDFGKEKIPDFIANCNTSLSMCDDLKHSISQNLEKYEIKAIEILKFIEEIKSEIEIETHQYQNINDEIEKKVKYKKRKKLEEYVEIYINACVGLNNENPNVYKLEDYCNNQVSKSTWDRCLKDGDFLEMAYDKINKKHYKQMKEKTKEFWINLLNSISDKKEEISNKKFENKEMSLDERIEYNNKKLDVLSYDFDE
jgi:hypothetical protein